MNRLKKGFTLIELLVVIAIIGVLAGIVLAALNTARNKGNDAAIKGNLSGIRAQAEIFYDNATLSYAGGTGVVGSPTACVTSFTANASPLGANYGLMGDSNFYNGVAGARTASGGVCSYINTASMWAVAVVLKTDTTKAWCVDSFGIAEQLGNGATAYDQTALNNDISAAGGCGS